METTHQHFWGRGQAYVHLNPPTPGPYFRVGFTKSTWFGAYGRMACIPDAMSQS